MVAETLFAMILVVENKVNEKPPRVGWNTKRKHLTFIVINLLNLFLASDKIVAFFNGAIG